MNKWWNAPTFTFKVNGGEIYVKVWTLVVAAFLLGLAIG